MRAWAGHGPGRPGGSSAVLSAGQASPRSLSQGRPRPPAKLRSGFAQPRWWPRTYKKIWYRNKKPDEPFKCKNAVAGLGPQPQGRRRSDRRARLARFMRVAQRGSSRGGRRGRGRDTLPTRTPQRPSPSLPAGFAGRTRRPSRKPVGGESGWREESLEGRRHLTSAQQIRFPLNAGQSAHSTAPSGKRPETL